MAAIVDVFDPRPCIVCRNMGDDEVVARFGGTLEYVNRHTPWMVELVSAKCRRCGSRLLRPLPGPQTDFLASPATVALFGGAAGGGKTYALLLSWLRHANTARARGLLARNTQSDLVKEGGLWGEATNLYSRTGPACPRPDCRPKPRKRCAVCRGTGTATVKFDRSSGSHAIRWPGGGSLEFAHLKGDGYKRLASLNLSWIGIEEAVECSMTALVFALTRLRSTTGIRPVLRMTTNPDPFHGLARWVDPWYLDDQGYPDMSKSGQIRYMLRKPRSDRFVSEATREAAQRAAGSSDEPFTFAYYPSMLESNIAYGATDPGFRGYKSKLAAQGDAKNEQLAKGNWRARDSGKGMLSRNNWGGEAVSLTEPLAPIVRVIRAWDKAATRPRPDYRNPDFSIGLRVEWDIHGRWYVSGMRALREETNKVDEAMAETAWSDGAGVIQVHEVEPGAAGKSDEQHTRKVLCSKYVAKGKRPPRVLCAPAGSNKVVKLQGVALQLELGMRSIPGWDPDEQLPHEPIGYILERPGEEWLDEPYSDAGDHPATLGDLFWEQIENFPLPGHKDDVPDTLGIAHKHRAALEKARANAAKSDVRKRISRGNVFLLKLPSGD